MCRQASPGVGEPSVIAEAPKDDAAAPAPAAPAPAEPAADAQPAVDEPRAEPAADAGPSAAEPAADAEPPADPPSAEPAADADSPAPGSSSAKKKRGLYKCGTCGEIKRTCKCKKSPSKQAADVTTVTGEPAFGTALQDQIEVLKESERQSKKKAEGLQGEASEAATLIPGLKENIKKLSEKLATKQEKLTKATTVVSRYGEALKEHAKHEQALEQRLKSQIPKPGFYDLCLPKGSGVLIADIMERIDPLFQAYIKDQSVTYQGETYPKSLYVGISNSLEQLCIGSNSRYSSHCGQFGQIIMMALLEMETPGETARMEKEVIRLAKWGYGKKLVKNARDGGGGVRPSEKYATRYFLYICFEA